MRRRPFHPVLFAAFPVLFLFARNANLVRPGKVVLPFLIVIASTCVLFGLAALGYRDVRRGAMAASGLTLLGLSYGHIWTFLSTRPVGGVLLGRDVILVPLWAVLASGVLVVAWRARSLDEFTGVLNAFALALVALVVFNTGTAIASQRSTPLGARRGETSRPVPVATGASGGQGRDIYYIILEDYASSDVLKRYFGVDNTAFLDALRKKGFYIADKAITNYPETAYSLASSMNMTYVDDLARDPGADSKDWEPLYKMLIGPDITRYLQKHGYTYVHMGSWYDPTANDPTAQINYHYSKTSEFSRVLIRTTILEPLAKRIGFLKAFDSRQAAHQQILFQFDSLEDVTKLTRPTFTFAHIMLPHDPYTFDAKGNYLDYQQEQARPFAKRYGDQVVFADKKVLELLDKLLAVPESRRPIVIIQSDEGPKEVGWEYGLSIPWRNAPDDLLKRKYPIFSSYYFPGLKKTGLYPSITPVNTFRLLRDLYFGDSMKLLPDDAVAYGDNDHLYRFTRVTDRVRGR